MILQLELANCVLRAANGLPIIPASLEVVGQDTSQRVPDMLELFRKQLGKVIFFGLIGMLVLSFAVWGIGDIFRGGGQLAPVAKVGDIEITGQQLNATFRRQIDRIRRTSNIDLDTEQARQVGILDTALQQLIQENLYALETSRLGLAVDDKQVGEQIRAEPMFQNRMGNFDPAIYGQVMAMSGLTKVAYEEARRLDIARRRLIDSLLAGNEPPERLTRLLYRYQKELRIIEIARLNFAKVRRPKAPDEAELRAFYDEHADRFMAPETRDFTYLRLDPAVLAKDSSVSDDELRDEYQARLDEFTVPETRKIRQLLLENEDRAKKAREALGAGGSLEDAAKRSGTKEKIADLGWVKKQDLFNEVVDVAFGLNKGEVGEPVESPFGWHLIEVQDIRPGGVKTFDEMREKLRQEIATRRAVETIAGLANRIEDELAGGMSLEEVAKDLTLATVTVVDVDRQGKTGGGKTVAALLDLPGALETAFNTPENEESMLADMPDGGAYVLRVDKVVAAHRRPFEEVRDKVAAAWQEAAVERATETEAKALLEDARNGKSLADAAKSKNLPFTTTPPITRADAASKLAVPQALAAAVFRLKKGEATTGRTDSGFVVARVAEIREPESLPASPTDSGDLAQIKQELEAQLSNDLLTEYGFALRQHFGVTVDRNAINSLF
jgi:peptidyl-prolyl cis-trans isomerase D